VLDPLQNKDNAYKKALAVVGEIDKIAEQGVPVFIAAGNKPGQLNLFGLASKAIVVATLDDPMKYSNSLSHVGIYSTHQLSFRRLGPKGPEFEIPHVGNEHVFRMTEDLPSSKPVKGLSTSSTSANPFEALSKLEFPEFKQHHKVYGTSLATPRALSYAKATDPFFNIPRNERTEKDVLELRDRLAKTFSPARLFF